MILQSKNIFTKTNIDMISSIIDDYASLIENIKDYDQLIHKDLELLDYFENNLTGKNLNLFKEFVKTNMRITCYENTLAYFLGIKLIDESRNIELKNKEVWFWSILSIFLFQSFKKFYLPSSR